MSESLPVWAPSRTYTPTATVEAQLDASFAADYRPCAACGAMIGDRETQGVCYPCSQGNRARGPIYGASLAGHAPAPGDALRAVEAVWITPVARPPCPDCAALADRSEALAARVDDLLEQNDDLALERSALARQVVALKGHLEELAAAVRMAKTKPNAPAT
jgi:hypothetical protein